MKSKIAIGLAVLLLIINCGSKLGTEKATEVIKTTFHLSDNDKVEVLGIAKEPDDIMLVKFKINGTEVSSKMREYDKGWQLDEVQNAFGGWIPAANVIGEFDPTVKVKTAMTEIAMYGTALIDYLTDHGILDFKGSTFFTESSEIYRALSPFYLTSINGVDPWGNLYLVYWGNKMDGSIYGLPPGDEDGLDFVICSYGRDGKKEDWAYDVNNKKAGLFKGDDPDKDIVYYNGEFVRAPESEKIGR